MMDEKEYKVCLCGDPGVGKTSITARYVWGNTSPTKTTIGMSMLTKTQTIGDRKFTLNIWDTAGQERYRSLIPLYFRDAIAAIVVFDVTRKTSFENLAMWLRIVKNTCKDNLIIMLAENKCDLSDLRAIKHQDAVNYAASINLSLFETSARSGEGIHELFEAICNRIPPEPSEQIKSRSLIRVTKPPEIDTSAPCCAPFKDHLK